MMDYREDLQKSHEYIKALEEERRKIEMFQRELPLCLEIVTQAIDACKQQLSATTTTTTTTTDCLNGQSDCSEQTTSYGPVFEEFIPIKRARASGDEEDGDELESNQKTTNLNDENDKFGSGKKSDWLRSAQLWNQYPDPSITAAASTKEEIQKQQPRKVSVVEVKTKGGAFHPFQKDKSSDCGVYGNNIMDMTNTTTTAMATAAPAPPPAPSASACSSAERAAAGGCETTKKDEAAKEGGQPRKARRCWSPELHRKFLNALEQFGGSHVATPKQIREFMKVDGLTNDEVKSHLQKYRLHTRRPTPAVHNNANTQGPQFVVVGGIWVPPTEYATAATSGVTTTLGDATAATITASPPLGVYSPPPPAQPHEATTVLAQRQQHPHEQSSQSAGSNSQGGTARCSSPSTSSSTHTVTASPAY